MGKNIAENVYQIINETFKLITKLASVIAKAKHWKRTEKTVQ